MIDAYFLFYSNTHEMNFTTMTPLRIPLLPNNTWLSYKSLQLFNKNGAHPFLRQKDSGKT